jgi:hypothetical protein
VIEIFPQNDLWLKNLLGFKPLNWNPSIIMNSQKEDMHHPPELDEEEQDHIRAVFDDEVVPKLVRLNARLGTLSCGFAGQEFEHWTIEFRSMGDHFEIVSFEYDEEVVSIDLGL